MAVGRVLVASYSSRRMTGRDGNKGGQVWVRLRLRGIVKCLVSVMTAQKQGSTLCPTRARRDAASGPRGPPGLRVSSEPAGGD